MFVVVVFVEQIKRIELLLLAFVHHCFEYSEQTEKKNTRLEKWFRVKSTQKISFYIERA